MVVWTIYVRDYFDKMIRTPLSNTPNTLAANGDARKQGINRNTVYIIFLNSLASVRARLIEGYLDPVVATYYCLCALILSQVPKQCGNKKTHHEQAPV